MQGARRSKTGVYTLVHEDFATTKQRSKRLEIRIRDKDLNLINVQKDEHQLSGTLNKGGCKLNLKTGNYGNITLQKMKN